MSGATGGAHRRANRRRGDTFATEHSDNADRWLLTYSDMITLLLVLFIVLFALSTINKAKYHEFKQSVPRAVLSEVPHGKTAAHHPTSTTRTATDRLQALRRELTAALRARGLLRDVTFSLSSTGLVEGLVADSTFFATASAALSTVGQEIVDTSARVLARVSNDVEVAGYTDNRAIIGGPYPNNWALSAARAATVVVRMTQVDGVSPTRVVLLGYGQYHPLATNATVAGRAENRRVNIVVRPMSHAGA